MTISERYRGCFIGLAIGDTLGMSVEFETRGDFEPLTKPEAGGPFDLPLGYWTDDTSMALSLADSFVFTEGYSSYSVMNRYTLWRDKGARSSTGVCFDIGNQVNTAINEYNTDGSAVIKASKERLTSAGNGSIMRLAPVVIASHAANNSLEETMELSRISGRDTHYSYMAEQGTALFGALLFNAFEQKSKQDIFNYGTYETNEAFDEIAQVVRNAPAKTIEELNPSGYIVYSLECVVWAFMNNDTFEDGALAAVNLGGDADTIGAIYGQLAGAYYGYQLIPLEWRNILHQHQEILDITDTLGQINMFKVLRTRFEEDGDKYSSSARLEVVKGNIANLWCDSIVNAANTELFGGSGVSGAIFDAAGYDEMNAACQAIGKCEYGEAVITPGFKLKASWVIHTVGPVYGQHGGDEAAILQSCYWQSLQLAENKHLKSVAFPIISAGIYGYPKQEAIDIAIRSIREYYEDNPYTSIQRVVLCAYTDDDKKLIESRL
jgi:ADP-ribosyl-[dinitrogen reductase] hydrolase